MDDPVGTGLRYHNETYNYYDRRNDSAAVARAVVVVLPGGRRVGGAVFCDVPVFLRSPRYVFPPLDAIRLIERICGT